MENLQTKIKDDREPKQGEQIQVRTSPYENHWQDGWIFLCKYEGKYVCKDKHDIIEFDQIRPTKPKETLQSVFKELKDEVYTGRNRSTHIREIVKRMETFITAQQ